MAEQREIDPVTGVETTGHEWDGIKELNKPLPKWWLWVLYASIVWSVGYWIAYPSWPLVASYTKGVLGYSQRATVMAQVEEGHKAQAKYRDGIANTALEEIKTNPDLLSFAIAGGQASFKDNCAPCHGRGAQGAKGYPNLNDDVWLWGGKIADIHRTLEVGIRSGHEETRAGDMPKFGIDGLLEPAKIDDAAEFVLSLGGRASDQEAAARGKALFEEQCASCHGEEGKGNPELGAPDLTDAVWLYGSEKADIVESIRTGRGGVMPAWAGRLDAVTLKQLAVYVHSLGGGQ